MQHLKVVAILCLTSASACFLSPSQAQAACSQWDMPARTGIKQSNGAVISITAIPSEGGFVGKATNYYLVSDGWLQGKRPEQVSGVLEGVVEGNTVHFTIHWDDDTIKEVANTTGVYTGSVGPQGRLTGTGYKAENPAETASWYAEEPLTCHVAVLPTSAPPSSSPAPPGWFNRADIASTPWALDDLNTVGWAQAARAANALCVSQGASAGHFSGHQDLSKGIFGGQCAKEDVVWRDVSAQEITASGWAFSDVNQVSWAQANRAAERLCASANQGFSGGHFNGQQLDGKYGLFCYRGASQWFDASDAELAATGWGFATPKLDDVQWSQAMRAATGFCQGKGFSGGFMNGHQAPNKYGVVCQKGVGY